MTKIGWISAPITATTGYGKVSRDILLRLADAGYDAVNIGGRGVITWGEKIWVKTDKGNQVLMVPCSGQVGDNATIEYYTQHYNLDAIISLWDSFVLPGMGRPKRPFCAYVPVDAPMTHKMANYLVNADIITAASQFGFAEMQKHFPDFMVKYIPHGTDTTIFKPRSNEERPKLRDAFNIPRDAFMFLFVGANLGERKCIPHLMLCFKRFMDKHPDSKAVLYLYTNIFMPYPSGFDIPGYAEQLSIQNKVIGPNFNTMFDSIEDDKLAELYACADVTINPSLGEGFGMALLESMACATPVIASNNSSMNELVKGHGWLVQTVPEDVWVDIPVWVPTLQEYSPPNLSKLLASMEDAYSNPDKLKKYGEKSRIFALQYDWTKIMPEWETLIKELIEGGHV